jgi:hypothetical protein
MKYDMPGAFKSLQIYNTILISIVFFRDLAVIPSIPIQNPTPNQNQAKAETGTYMTLGFMIMRTGSPGNIFV